LVQPAGEPEHKQNVQVQNVRFRFEHCSMYIKKLNSANFNKTAA
jgi:hypothetical protein